MIAGQFLYAALPQQRLYFRPLPHGQAAFRPTLAEPPGLALRLDPETGRMGLPVDLLRRGPLPLFD